MGAQYRWSSTSPSDALPSWEPLEVFLVLGTRPEGLTDDEVAKRQCEHGPNQLEVVAGSLWPRLLVNHFTNFFSLLLAVAAGLCFLVEWLRPGDNLGVLGVALLGVGGSQRARAAHHFSLASVSQVA